MSSLVSKFRSSNSPAAPSPTQKPAEAVKGAIAAGISSRRKIAEVTGLRATTVDLILERLEANGSLRRENLGGMCPGGGCSNCGMSEAGTCASGDSGAANGPVALVLTRRPGIGQ